MWFTFDLSFFLGLQGPQVFLRHRLTASPALCEAFVYARYSDLP